LRNKTIGHAIQFCGYALRKMLEMLYFLFWWLVAQIYRRKRLTR
jgi:hypothetical protein